MKDLRDRLVRGSIRAVKADGESSKPRYRSPGRKATARALATPGPVATTIDELEPPTYVMRGFNVPEAIEEDRQFFELFQEWKQRGGKENDPLVHEMRKRWAEVMGDTV